MILAALPASATGIPLFASQLLDILRVCTCEKMLNKQLNQLPFVILVAIESMFVRGQERWTAQDAGGHSNSLTYNSLTQSVGVSAPGNIPVYFIAPGNFI